MRYSGHNWLWHLGKYGGRKLALGKEGKMISMPQKFSFKLQIFSGKFRVRNSNKEYIEATDFKQEKRLGDGLKGKKDLKNSFS